MMSRARFAGELHRLDPALSARMGPLPMQGAFRLACAELGLEPPTDRELMTDLCRRILDALTQRQANVP
jgi:hypothetical protein